MFFSIFLNNFLRVSEERRDS